MLKIHIFGVIDRKTYSFTSFTQGNPGSTLYCPIFFRLTYMYPVLRSLDASAAISWLFWVSYFDKTVNGVWFLTFHGRFLIKIILKIHSA